MKDRSAGTTSPEPPQVQSETSLSQQSASDEPVNQATIEGAAELERLDAALAEQRAAAEKLRAETPPQLVRVRPGQGQELLGLVVRDTATGQVLATKRMKDWRTQEITLQAGQHAVILVLAGSDLELFESLEFTLLLAPPPVQEVDRPVGD